MTPDQHLSEPQMKILKALKKRNKLTYPELVLATDLSYKAVVNNVKFLCDMGKVEISEVSTKGHHLKFVRLK